VEVEEGGSNDTPDDLCGNCLRILRSSLIKGEAV
jgi:hypothetical protein